MKEYLLKMSQGWAHQAGYEPDPTQALIWTMFYLWASEEVEEQDV